MKFCVKENNFYLEDEKIFLNSGEIHYFRIKRELWGKHLNAAKEAGINTISTYIPWAWHEFQESVFDFDGSSCPERDLKGWLKCCQDHGLTCIVKPGPFILAEFRGAGLPDWFLDQYRDQVKMRNRRGDIVQSDGVSLFNQKYLEKVTLWYDQIMPLISSNEIKNDGPIIMMQICNEIGVFSWLAHQADYSNDIKDYFISYISRKYLEIDKINGLWETNFNSFSEIELPPDSKEPYQSKGDRSRDYDWHQFWREYYGHYLKKLSLMARSRGVSIPLYHNLPGWIYGNGYEFPVNITMYEALFRDRSEILFGVDHIPEFMSYRNLHDDRIINDITVSMQGNKPLFAAEFQCGSREYHVVTNPRELELFYKASISNGLKGWNYYMFSQGRNPARKGYSGEIFYWFTPLSYKGDHGTTFPLVKRMSNLIKTSEKIILDASRRSAICVTFYPHYYATELERPYNGTPEMKYLASAIRRPAYFDGLLKILQVLNIDYDMIDLKHASASELKNYKQVWVFSTDEMNAKDQEKVVEYTSSGGNMVIFPYLPDRELSQNPCTIIREALHIYPIGTETIDSPLIDILGFKDIKCSNPQIIYPEATFSEHEIIARNLNGNVCGFIKRFGRGSIVHLGTWLGFDTEGHKPVYESILNFSDGQIRQATSSNEFIIARERFTSEGTGLLFIGNYYNEEQKGSVQYSHPGHGEIISLPYSKEEGIWPPIIGILTPLCLQLSKGLFVLHCTSDILKIDSSNENIDLYIYGRKDMFGEIVLERDSDIKINAVRLNGHLLHEVVDANRSIYTYVHHPESEMILNIAIR